MDLAKTLCPVRNATRWEIFANPVVIAVPSLSGTNYCCHDQLMFLHSICSGTHCGKRFIGPGTSSKILVFLGGMRFELSTRTECKGIGEKHRLCQSPAEIK
jgi:hypothetical protein